MPVRGNKTKLQIGDGATYADSNSWTDLAKIIDLTPPEIAGEDIDSSSMDDDFKIFTPGISDGGSVELSLHFEKSQMATLYTSFMVPKGFRVVLADAPAPSGSKWGFDGYINKLGNEVERAGLTTIKVGFKVSGKPVFVPAA